MRPLADGLCVTRDPEVFLVTGDLAWQVHIDLPTLTAEDKKHLSTWGVRNNIDIVSLSFTRHASDVREV